MIPVRIDPEEAARLRAAYLAERPGSIGPFAERLGVPEAAVLAAFRGVGGGKSTELDLSRFDEWMEALAGLNPVRVIVRTDGCVKESAGDLGGYRKGKFFNVLNGPIHLHLSPERFATAFAVWPARGWTWKIERLGADLDRFYRNLDVLHDHLHGIYPAGPE